MSALLTDLWVTVFIGNSFEFIVENTAMYSVIVTDSSDPPLLLVDFTVV